MACSKSERGDIHVKHVSSRSCDLPVCDLSHTASAVGMIVNRDIYGFLNSRHGLRSGRRIDHAAHVFQMDCCCTDVYIVYRSLYEGFNGVNRAGGKLNVALHAFSGFQRCLSGTRAVSDII